jgi:lactoylglutathione lyase
MPFRINHIHLKAPDPEKTASWYVVAFNFKIVSDVVRPTGERFIRCSSEDDGMIVNISGARAGDSYGAGDASLHFGLEHFGVDSADIEADIARLQGLGAELLDGPTGQPGATRIAYVRCPDDVRIELIQAAASA